MIYPKISFRYSGVYDKRFKKEVKGKKYPNPRKVLSRMRTIKKEWKKFEKRYMRELSKVIGLPWKEKEIICYVVGHTIPFSDPLTIPSVKKYPGFHVNVLAHELVHRILTQEGNEDKCKSSWRYISKKYQREEPKVRLHIVIHAFHKHLCDKLLGKDMLKAELKWVSYLAEKGTERNKLYKRAWDIVEKEGDRDIIKEFKSRLK